MRVSRVAAAGSPGPLSAPRLAPGALADECPLTEDEAEAQAHGICFKTGPPGRIGVELEWLVRDGRDPAVPVDQRALAAVRAELDEPGALPGGGRLTVEPGGQLELSSAPAGSLAACLASAHADLAALRQAAERHGLRLAGTGLDGQRPPRRVLEEPRYAAMEEFFDRSGPWGRVMMCSTASVQICLEAGEEGAGPSSYLWRWRLLHAIGPVMVAMFANSPFHRGRATGWKSTRQAIWTRLDPTRTRPPRRAAGGPRADWAAYALAANVLCVRRPAPRGWAAPPGLTFRRWLRGAGERPATRADLDYHLSTLFPPVRPRGHLEFRAIDAQPGDGWAVPTAVVSALVDDPAAAQEAMAAAERLWGGADGLDGDADRARAWLRAARHGPADPGIAAAGRRCYAAAQAALERSGAPAPVRRAVAAFGERYLERGRCPADDRLDGAPPRPAPQEWP